jgi:hypothetical protein
MCRQAEKEAQGLVSLLQGLNGGIEQNAIEATVPEGDAILVMFQKSVHGRLRSGEIPWRILPWALFTYGYSPDPTTSPDIQ